MENLDDVHPDLAIPAPKVGEIVSRCSWKKDKSDVKIDRCVVVKTFQQTREHCEVDWLFEYYTDKFVKKLICILHNGKIETYYGWSGRGFAYRVDLQKRKFLPERIEMPTAGNWFTNSPVPVWGDVMGEKIFNSWVDPSELDTLA